MNVTLAKQRCQRQLRSAQNSLQAILTSAKKIFSISLFMNVTLTKQGCQYNYVVPRTVCKQFQLLPKIFFSISLFMNVTLAKQRCQRQLRGAKNSLQVFYFSLENVLFNQSHGQGSHGSYAVPRTVYEHFFSNEIIFL